MRAPRGRLAEIYLPADGCGLASPKYDAWKMREWWGSCGVAAKVVLLATAAIAGLLAVGISAAIIAVLANPEFRASVTAPTPAGILEIVRPADGAIVTTNSVQVVGRAPAGAEIVQDVSFASDRRTSANAEGDWTLTVDLETGDNDLTFRIGSDRASAVALRVTYEREVAALSLSPSPTSTSSPTVSPTASPTPSAAPTLNATDRQTPTARPTPRLTPTARPTPRPTLRAAPRPTPTPTPRPRLTARPTPTPATVAVINDAARDLEDEDGLATSGPGYADIVQVSVKSEGDDWLLSIVAAENLVWRDPFYEPLYYGFWLDTNGDEDPDYTVSLENGSERNEWIASLFSFDDLYTYAEDEFPGVATPIGRSAVIRLEADAIGDPRVLYAAAHMERALWNDPTNDPFERNETYDLAPDDQYPDDRGDWIEARRR